MAPQSLLLQQSTMFCSSAAAEAAAAVVATAAAYFQRSHHVVTCSRRLQGSSPPSLDRPVSLRLPTPRSSLSLSSAYTCCYPSQARMTLLPAALAPSSSGLRTTATPFTSQGGPRPRVASLPRRRARTLRPVSASSILSYLPFRTTICFMLVLASRSHEFKQFIIGPLLLLCGVQPSFLLQALSYVYMFLFCATLVCNVFDMIDLYREGEQMREHQREEAQILKNYMRGVLQKLGLEEEYQKMLEEDPEIGPGSGTFKPGDSGMGAAQVDVMPPTYPLSLESLTWL